MERIEAWTVAQAADLLSATHISSPSTPPPTSRTVVDRQLPRGHVVTLAIPLDDNLSEEQKPSASTRPAAPATPPAQQAVHTVHKRRAPIRRDSLARREALLKGKEGSRARRRWENAHLIGNPHAEPPLPVDWEARPTWPVKDVPYFLAPLWDTRFAKEVAAEQQEAQKRSDHGDVAQETVVQLREKLKKARGARGLLQDLEEVVRAFVEEWDQRERELENDDLVEGEDGSDDEEIVFVGRGGVTLDERRKREGLEKDLLVYQSAVGDRGAAFGRYLVHSIAEYYGLRTWSTTTSARREAYVGLKTDPVTRRPSWNRSHMPRPLWTVV